MHRIHPHRAAGLVTVLFLSLSGCLGAQTPPAAAAAPALESEDSKTLYALGLALGQNLGTFNLTPAELDIVRAGLSDAVLKQEPKVALEEYGPKIQVLAKARMAEAAGKEKAEAAKFLEQSAAAPGAVAKPSGLIISEIAAGTGASPGPTDTVTVHYHGTLRDGTVFDSSVDRGEPATFALNQVVPCWTEALQLMKVGGKVHVVCPAAIAYGDQGRPPKILPGAALAFNIELLSIAGGGTNAQ